MRIKSHSIRFRLKGDDLDQFVSTGSLVEETHIPTTGGQSVVFRMGLTADTSGGQSRMFAEPYSLILTLSSQDMAALKASDNTGVYVRSEWINETGKPIRFVAYVEKDKKDHKRKDKKPERESHGYA